MHATRYVNELTWKVNEQHKFKFFPIFFSLGTQEPVHCVTVNEEGKQLITGSTGNRIAIRRGFTADSPFSSSKVKSDILKGNLTSMRLLPLNRLLLLGEDTGKIRLIC